MKGYLDFLRYCLSPNSTLPYNPECIEWKGLMGWAEQQAIVGICFGGIEKLKKSDINIPFSILMEWIGYANKIEQQNHIVNKRCVELVREFENAGFRCCLLKGQGNAMLYPAPFRRSSGDIDLLVLGGRNRVTRYVLRKFPHSKAAYQHIDYPVFKDVPVEIHYLPINTNNPIYNQRMQNWFEKEYERGFIIQNLSDGCGAIPVPTWEFNVIYQLAHIQHHFFDVGIGFRQLIDYYYLLQNTKEDVIGKMENIRKTLKYLNLYDLARAVMYIMVEVLGLESKFQIVPIDERRGKTMLHDILKGGNFGNYSGIRDHSMLRRHLLMTKRNLLLIGQYPQEALAEPFFRIYHFIWRLKNK